MEITELVEKNSTLLRLGLHFEYNDARHRVAAHLQRNIDRSEFNYVSIFFTLCSLNHTTITKITISKAKNLNFFFEFNYF